MRNAAQVPRYRFGPLERRGLIGSLRPGQLIVLGLAVFGTVLTVQILRSGIGLAIGALLLVLGAGATFVPLGGRVFHEWIPVMAVFGVRKLTGKHRYRSGAPQAGTHFRQGDVAVPLPDAIGKVELLSFPYRGVELGVLADRRGGTYTAVIQARARSFALLDYEDKAQRLSAWAGVISGLARDNSPIARVQWLERTVPDDGNGLGRYLRDSLDPTVPVDSPALQSYLALTQAAGPATEQHELYVVLQLNASRANRLIKQAGGKDTGACTVLARELDTFARRLDAAEVEVMHALGPRRLAAAIRLAFDPNARSNLNRLGGADPSREEGVSARNAWPRSAETKWSYYRTNDVFHATYWIAEWPRLEVGPEFLAPLLVQTRVMRTVSVTMEPVPAVKAMRAVGFAKTADVSEEVMRERLGFIGTARRRSQMDAVERREHELTEGHADVRFSGYITVTANNLESLQGACAEVEHAASLSRLELQRCDGEQDVAFSFTLPLGRGLK
jgi:type VII ESX secretion system EccE translocon-like protein